VFCPLKRDRKGAIPSAHTSDYPSKCRRRDAHRLGRDKGSLVPERRDARDLLPLSTHLLNEHVPDIRIRARLIRIASASASAARCVACARASASIRVCSVTTSVTLIMD
jgi:hypothetical protein